MKHDHATLDTANYPDKNWILDRVPHTVIEKAMRQWTVESLVGALMSLYKESNSKDKIEFEVSLELKVCVWIHHDFVLSHTILIFWSFNP